MKSKNKQTVNIFTVVVAATISTALIITIVIVTRHFVSLALILHYDEVMSMAMV